MAAVKKRTTKSKQAGQIADEDMSPSQRVARDILVDFSDLQPSVNRIMEADIDEEQRLRAIEQFRNALGATDDPNRDPRYAIAHCGPAAKV